LQAVGGGLKVLRLVSHRGLTLLHRRASQECAGPQQERAAVQGGGGGLRRLLLRAGSGSKGVAAAALAARLLRARGLERPACAIEIIQGLFNRLGVQRLGVSASGEQGGGG
jgi:hypothetical protein